MNRIIRSILTFLPHLIIAMSITLLTLSITDYFNTAMAFINHPMTKRLIVIYCLISLCICLVQFVLRMGHGIHKAILPLICTLVAVAMLIALFYDWMYPREILFARGIGKTLIFVNTMVSLVNAAYTAFYNRRMARRRSARIYKNRQ